VLYNLKLRYDVDIIYVRVHLSNTLVWV
jgi:hypothetical protein